MARWSSLTVILATIVTMIATAVITIAKEMSEPVKDAFTAIGGHHWVGTSIVLVIIFAIFAFIPEKILWRKPSNVGRWTWVAMVVSLLSFLAIFLFYVVHYVAG